MVPRNNSAACHEHATHFLTHYKVIIVMQTNRKLAQKGGRLGAWGSFCFRGFLISEKLRVINVEDHAARCRMAREIIIIIMLAIQQCAVVLL